MKLGSILYLPPTKSYANANAILENLKRFPPHYPLLVYSEVDYGWPGQILLKISPEVAKETDGVANQGQLDFRIANTVFITGLQLARRAGFTHIIYLENDCRVGRGGWDRIMFEEYFQLGRSVIAAGSLAFYNPANAGPVALRRWQQIVAQQTRKNFPCPTYGWVAAAIKHPSCVFPNGALSIYDMTWMQRFFKMDNAVYEGVNMGPFDMVVGEKIWEKFAEDSYDVVGTLRTIFSGYGEVVTTEAERLAWLRSGEIVAVHQVKSGEQP